MKKIYRILTVVILLSLSLTAKSQSEAIGLTLMPHVPYGNLYNPALPISSNIFVGVGISNINLSTYNSSIKYKNIYNYEDGKPVSINATQLINSLDEHDNFISTNFSLDLFRFGFKIKKLLFDVSWKVKYHNELHYSRDFLGFFVNGNGNYLGDKYADFSVGVDMSLLTEIAFGVQYAINDKLTVALRPKLICGVANAQVNDDNTKIYTNANTYDMYADINLNVKMSTMFDLGDDLSSIDFSNISLKDAIRLKDNFGYGIDLGASYTFNKHFGVALGVYDLGYIKWKNTRETHVVSDNVVINDALCKDYEDLMNLELDFDILLKDMVDNIWGDATLDAGADYKSALKTRIMLQGYYELCPMVRFTAISQLYYVNKKMRPMMTLAYSGTFFNIFDLTTSYTMSKFSGNSLSAGIAFNLGLVKFYLLSDNIMVLSKVSKTTVELLTSYEVANFRLGLIFTLGHK